MDKNDLRKKLMKEGHACGNAVFELQQLNKMRQQQDAQDIMTLTATCTEILSLVCC